MAFSQDTDKKLASSMRGESQQPLSPSSSTTMFDAAGGWRTIDAFMAGKPSPETARPAPANEGVDKGASEAAVATLKDDEALDGEGFGARYTRARAALSEFTASEPVSAAGASEKLRRDINSVVNIGGGGGGLYTEDRNPWGETKEDKKQRLAGEALEGMVEASEEQRKKEWQERWDKQMSQDFPDLTNGEVLQSLKRINKDPRKSADDAVKRGDIRADQKDDFMVYMKLMEQNEEFKRNHNGKSDPALVSKMSKIDNANGGTIKPALMAAVKDDRGRHRSNALTTTVEAGDGQTDNSFAQSDDLTAADPTALQSAARQAVREDLTLRSASRNSESAMVDAPDSSVSSNAWVNTKEMASSVSHDELLANPIQAASPREAF